MVLKAHTESDDLCGPCRMLSTLCWRLDCWRLDRLQSGRLTAVCCWSEYHQRVVDHLEVEGE